MIPRSKHGLIILLMAFSLFVAVTPVRAEMEDYPVVKLQSLGKVTARTMTFEARVGSTVKYGPLYIKTQACRKASPIDQPESAAFIQIWEVTPDKKAKWVFSGWMFASSPALSSMDHPIYDVWVVDCLGDPVIGKEDVDDASIASDALPDRQEEEPAQTPGTPDGM